MMSPKPIPSVGSTRPALILFSARRPRIAGMLVIGLFILLTLLVSACGGASVGSPSANAGGTTVSNQPSTDKAPAVDSVDAVTQPEFLSTASGYPIKVFFSKRSEPNFGTVFPVDRVSPTKAVATFALQLLIAGPTPTERDAGYFTELNSLLNGDSVCIGSATPPVGGPDFTLILNKKGTATEDGTVTVKFCRTTISNGVGEDARVTSQITATLKQFSTIKKVVILTKDNHCFGDESGQDLCLR
jgi:spore germination protein GerM